MCRPADSGGALHCNINLQRSSPHSAKSTPISSPHLTLWETHARLFLSKVRWLNPRSEHSERIASELKQSERPSEGYSVDLLSGTRRDTHTPNPVDSLQADVRAWSRRSGPLTPDLLSYTGN